MALARQWHEFKVSLGYSEFEVNDDYMKLCFRNPKREKRVKCTKGRFPGRMVTEEPGCAECIVLPVKRLTRQAGCKIHR